jgi:ppGpp synthetase/RelA/SpoT-type nucleotidyltranferase
MNKELIEIQYQDALPRLERLNNELVNQINTILVRDNIRLAFPIQNRVKSIESIINKCQSGRYNIKKTIFELQDLVGLRLILLFRNDIDIIANAISQSFNVINSYNTIDKLEYNQFGYSSIHMIVSIPEDWSKIPSFSGLDSITFELQIRTISQHIWSEASNYLQYKKESNVPKELLRATGRVSALLEIIDLELERLIIDREVYVNGINIKQLQQEEKELDVDSLEKILDEYLPYRNKEFAERYDDLINELKLLKIDTVDKLIMFLIKNMDYIKEQDKSVVEIIKNELKNGKTPQYALDKVRLKDGVFYSHIGLVRIAIIKEFGENYLELNKSNE